ncbi:hypothetical protein [Pseudomonas sp. MYb185]|uniref:hypothetical protein n=1 Tax=Pseudomonas sp. MYb185 TaxID=1848729 RepID=UPI000CFAC005|nr:hypothetical protein [Pseudomonas sp. MYb185]PRB80481.1 hypothetical protein CQ007_12200 [Pseudomonas sp. MYb185]
MLIPGLPPAGAQQEVFKPDRQVRTTAAEGLAHDPLSELPVEEQASAQYHGQHSGGEQSPPQDTEAAAAEVTAEAPAGSPELPRKGLLVDIRA